MRFLFVHQNFPGQYRHLAAQLARAGHEVVAIGETANLHRTPRLAGVKLYGYEAPAAAPNGFSAPVERAVNRGRRVAAGAARLKQAGFKPDVIGAHIGWGEALFLKDVFPEAKLLLYCEFFYRPRGADLDVARAALARAAPRQGRAGRPDPRRVRGRDGARLVRAAATLGPGTRR